MTCNKTLSTTKKKTFPWSPPISKSMCFRQCNLVMWTEHVVDASTTCQLLHTENQSSSVLGIHSNCKMVGKCCLQRNFGRHIQKPWIYAQNLRMLNFLVCYPHWGHKSIFYPMSLTLSSKNSFCPSHHHHHDFHLLCFQQLHFHHLLAAWLLVKYFPISWSKCIQSNPMQRWGWLTLPVFTNLLASFVLKGVLPKFPI